MNAGTQFPANLPGAMALRSGADMAAELAHVLAAAQAAGSVGVARLAMPGGELCLVFIPASAPEIIDGEAKPVNANATVMPEDLLEDVEAALKSYHSVIALKGNGLVNTLNLGVFHDANDRTAWGQGMALKRAIQWAVAELAQSLASKDHELATYFDLRYDRAASTQDIARILFYGERTAQRRNERLVQRLAEVLTDHCAASRG